MNVSDEKGKLICTVWAAKSLDTKATAEQAKAGLKYSHVEETTIVGAVKFAEEWKDYRKQKIKPGVYTLRLGVQPMDGDHMGTAPYNEFALLCPAAEDKTAGPAGRERAVRTQRQVHGAQAPRHDAPVPEQGPGGSARDGGQAEGTRRAELPRPGHRRGARRRSSASASSSSASRWRSSHARAARRTERGTRPAAAVRLLRRRRDARQHAAEGRRRDARLPRRHAGRHARRRLRRGRGQAPRTSRAERHRQAGSAHVLPRRRLRLGRRPHLRRAHDASSRIRSPSAVASATPRAATTAACTNSPIAARAAPRRLSSATRSACPSATATSSTRPAQLVDAPRRPARVGSGRARTSRRSRRTRSPARGRASRTCRRCRESRC